MLGVNEDDAALGKGPLPASILGSTTLGCDLATAKGVEAGTNRGRTIAQVVDLSGCPTHDFKEYAFRKAFLNDILGAVLADAGVARR